MAEPALIQVIEAFKTLLEQIDDITVFVDRADDEPVNESEMPAIVIRTPDHSLDERPEGDSTTTLIHSVTMNFDFYVKIDVTDNISFQHQRLIAAAAQLIYADWQLGGRLSHNTLISVSANQDNVPDAGVAVLESEIKFLTRASDWTQITTGDS